MALLSPREWQERRKQRKNEGKDALARDHPQVVIGVAGSLHGYHMIVAITRHAYRPAIRVRWYEWVPIADGSRALARLVRRAGQRALRISPSVAVVVDVTASGPSLMHDVRSHLHLPEQVTVFGLVVGGGQAEPGGAGDWRGGTASRPALIYTVQQLSVAGQLQVVDGFGELLSLFRRRHETTSAADETAWNSDVTDVPGVALCAGMTRWMHWRAWDAARLRYGSREQLIADHPECRNGGSQYHCCCRVCSYCARKWHLPPPELRRDPGFCDYCVEVGLAPPEGNMRVWSPVEHRIDRTPISQRRHDPDRDGPLWLPEGIEAAAEAARLEKFGGSGARIGPRWWEHQGRSASEQLPDIGTDWWE